MSTVVVVVVVVFMKEIDDIKYEAMREKRLRCVKSCTCKKYMK